MISYQDEGEREKDVANLTRMLAYQWNIMEPCQLSLSWYIKETHSQQKESDWKSYVERPIAGWKNIWNIVIVVFAVVFYRQDGYYRTLI